MSKCRKPNLTPHNPEIEIPKSSIGFSAFEFYKNIARKYGIFRKPGNLPALIFIRLTGKRAEINSVKPNYVISANNYFTFHLSFYFKIIRQLMKSDRMSVPYSIKTTGSVNYHSEPFLQERHLIFLKMPGIKNDPISVRQVLKVHDSSREVFTGITTRTFLRDTDFISQLNYLNSFRQIIPNTSSQEMSGILPLNRTGSDEDLFRMNMPVESETGRFSLITYPTHRSIILDTVNSHLRHYMYHWNVSKESAAGYLPFQRAQNRDTIITLNPQNTAVSFVWRNFNIGGSTSQRTVMPPPVGTKEHTQSPQISMYPPENAAFPLPVRFSHFRQNSYIQNMYYGNISRKPSASYFQFQRPLNRDTIITLNPQNTAVTFVWRNFNIGGSISQRTALTPAEQKRNEWQHTESPHINVYNVENTASSGTKELSTHENSRRADHSLKKRIIQGIYNRKVFPGTGFFSHLITRQANLTLEHQNTPVEYLKVLKKALRGARIGNDELVDLLESSSVSLPSRQELDHHEGNIALPMRSDNSILIHNRTVRNIHYKNNSSIDEAFFPSSNAGMPKISLSHSNPMVVTDQRRTLIAGIGGSVNYITALQAGRQTSDRKAQSYEVSISGTAGFTMDDSVNIPFSHPGARQVNEVQKSVGTPVIHLQRPVNAGKTGPEYSMNVASGIRHSSSGGQYSGFEENSGVSLKQSTLPFQYNTTLQNRHLRNIRNMLVGWKNSNITMSTQKRSITMIPVNPVPENIYFRESTNSGYNDAVKSKMNPLFAVKGVNPRNSAELILKKNAVQRTGQGAGNKDNIQSERTASTKTNDTLNTESIKQRPAQELSIIADRVYKIIERKLSKEKDRRGLL